MKVLDRILRRHPAEESTKATADTPACAHAVIVPRWDRVADIGNKENVSGYAFAAEEGHRLQESLADRVHLGSTAPPAAPSRSVSARLCS